MSDLTELLKRLNARYFNSTPMMAASMDDAARVYLLNAEMAHRSKQNLEDLRGHDPLTDWGIGVAQRFANPLNTLGQMANEVRQMTPEELGLQFAGGGMFGHTAWHGSPHVFDKFALEKIGTGEGAQAYGHGLYLAENPEVAKSYQDLAKLKGVLVDGKPFDRMKSSMSEAALLNMYQNRLAAGLSPEKAAEQTVKWGENNPQIGKDVADSFVKRLSPPSEGSVYKVDIPDTHIDRMLDWDKPLSEQHPDVQAAWKNTKSMLPQNAIDDLGGDLSILYGKDVTPADFLGTMSQLGGKTNAGEEMFAKQGIPGIKYLDQGSRDAGKGSRNFVMFNPDDIRILERNGVATGAKPWAEDAAISAPKPEKVRFMQDNPMGEWLKEKQQEVIDAGINKHGAPKRLGTVTGTFQGDGMTKLNIPLSKLRKLKGLMGEQNNVRQHSLEYLKDYMGKHGKLPPLSDSNPKEYAPFINVDQNGVAWINEGNHRIMSADQLGWNHMPVEVRYFNGGELVKGDWSPEELIKEHGLLSNVPRLK